MRADSHHIDKSSCILIIISKLRKQKNTEWMIFLGYENGESALYNLDQEKFNFELEAHDNSICRMDVLVTSEHNLLLATVSVDKLVKVHDLLMKSQICEFTNHLSTVVECKFVNFHGLKSYLISENGKTTSYLETILWCLINFIQQSFCIYGRAKN